MSQLPDLDFEDYVDSMSSVAAFRSGDVINLNGPNGPAKMDKDNLLKENAQNTLASNVAQAFDPTRTSENPYKAGDSVVYDGKTYTFKVDHYGAWSAADVFSSNIQSFLSSVAYTSSPFFNKAFVYIYIDASGYSGSADISEIFLRRMYRGQSGTWGFALNDKNGNLLAIFENSVEFKYLDQVYSGIHVKAIINWDALEIGVNNPGNGTIFTDFAYHDFMIFVEMVSRDIANVAIYYERVGYMNATGFSTDPNYHCRYTNDITAKEGDVFMYKGYAASASRSVCFLSESKSVISSAIYNSTSKYTKITCPQNTAYVRFSSYADLSSPIIFDVYKENTQISSIHDSIDSSNSLAGKVWYACGDSFTSGDFTGYDGDDAEINSGMYKGQKAVYPFFVGNNTGLIVKNLAQGGATLSTNNSTNNFVGDSVGKIYQIQSDADFITLKFGINDFGRNVNLGSIDSTDKSTFYGAWNFALDYLITNFPKAHIGIIITNGISNNTAFQEATKNIAEKWGVPYLDEDGGVDCPTMLHCSSRNTASDYVKSLRTSQQRISASNFHPTPDAFKFESTFIEHFIRSL